MHIFFLAMALYYYKNNLFQFAVPNQNYHIIYNIYYQANLYDLCNV